MDKEVLVRQSHGFNPQFVMQQLPGPSEEEFSEAVKTLGEIQGKDLSTYHYGIIMPEADRSLHAIYTSERPDDDHIRTYFTDVFLAIAHLHEKGVGHFDIKLMNALRNNGHICITDLDASATLGSEYAGAKFSSGVLPPEMLAKLETDEDINMYEEYFTKQRENQPTLWGKNCPVHTTEGTFVIRTFVELVRLATLDNIAAKVH
jgi:serine/threonine protein kinase